MRGTRGYTALSCGHMFPLKLSVSTVLNTTGHLTAAALVARSCNDSVDNASLDRTATGELEPSEVIAHERF